MHIHILGIGGTFMGSLAVLARQLGYKVTGSDQAVYPPMSDLLREAGIDYQDGYDADFLKQEPDCVVVGNAMSRGNVAVEALLNSSVPFTSGPAFLGQHVLQNCWVLAVAGTHGKTTTASMLAWILEYNDMQPGFLIGGAPLNFSVSARLGGSPFFVIEADEYDTAFFDKRSKFLHYRARTLIMNNLEFDHADIFHDISDIQRQFHHLVRTVPANGKIIYPKNDTALQAVIDMGCWTPLETASLHARDTADWLIDDVAADQSHCTVRYGDEQYALQWSLQGTHNLHNALMAIAAAHHVGVRIPDAIEALSQFKNVKRRMELRGEVNGVRVYDDFAHHPTAIATTLQGARQHLRNQGRLLAVLEPRSNTMRMGVHQHTLAGSLAAADAVWLFEPADLDWSLQTVTQAIDMPVMLSADLDALIADIVSHAQAGDDIVIMSNGAFGGIYDKLLHALSAAATG